jgi:hypothetical protein
MNIVFQGCCKSKRIYKKNEFRTNILGNNLDRVQLDRLDIRTKKKMNG